VSSSGNAENAESSRSARSSPGTVSNMHPPPLPSRVGKTDRDRLLQTRLQLSSNSQHVPATATSRPSLSFVTSAPSRFPSSATPKSQRKISDPKPTHGPKRNDIPSSLDSALFSAILSKKASSSFLVKRPESNSADVIEISDNEDSVLPPSSDKGKVKLSTSSLFAPQKTPNRDKSDATSWKQRSNTPQEIIEIIDSDEEIPRQTTSSRIQTASKDLEPNSPSIATRTDGSYSSTPRLSDDDDEMQDIDLLLKGKSMTSIQSTFSATAPSGANKAHASQMAPSIPVTPPPPSERQMRPLRATATSVTGHDHEQQQEPGVVSSPSGSSSSGSSKNSLNRQGFNSMSVPSDVPTISLASNLPIPKAPSSNFTSARLAVPNKASPSSLSAHSLLRAGFDVESENSDALKRSSLICDEGESSIDMRDLDTALGTPFSQSPRMKPGSGPRGVPNRSLVPVAFFISSEHVIKA
jgi:hypothetical protein